MHWSTPGANGTDEQCRGGINLSRWANFLPTNFAPFFAADPIFSGDFPHRRGVCISTSDSNAPAQLLLLHVALLLAVLGNVIINPMSTDIFPETNDPD